MTAQQRIYYENTVYHAMSRGNNKQKVLNGETSKILFIDILEKYRKRFAFKLYAFVLMDNHFHLILEANRRHSISKVMQAVLLS